MTQQPPTDYPGDVVVTGQRRQADGSFLRPAVAAASRATTAASIRRRSIPTRRIRHIRRPIRAMIRRRRCLGTPTRRLRLRWPLFGKQRQL